MTNPARLYGPRHLDSFIVTPNPRSPIGIAKTHANPDADAPNETAGPLGASVRASV
jgi:hypothetical protein